MGAGTDDFKRLSKQHAERGFYPDLPTQAMPTPVTRGARTLSEAKETVRQMLRVQARGTFFAWRLGLLQEHGLYDPTPTSGASSRDETRPFGQDHSTTPPPIYLWEEEPEEYVGPVEVVS